MSEQEYSPMVRDFRTFWKSLQRWVKMLIFWVGFATGFGVWLGSLSAIFPFLALIFLGQGTPALTLKIFVVLGVLASLGIFIVVAIWLLRLIAYGLCWLILADSENTTFESIIFTKNTGE